jgi:hypothetical protein
MEEIPIEGTVGREAKGGWGPGSERDRYAVGAPAGTGKR